jgi:alcohol dehydrogenase class IV
MALSLKVTLRLRDLGVKREEIPFIVSHAYTPERASNNPRKIDQPSIEHLLGEIH